MYLSVQESEFVHFVVAGGCPANLIFRLYSWQNVYLVWQNVYLQCGEIFRNSFKAFEFLSKRGTNYWPIEMNCIFKTFMFNSNKGLYIYYVIPKHPWLVWKIMTQWCSCMSTPWVTQIWCMIVNFSAFISSLQRQKHLALVI